MTTSPPKGVILISGDLFIECLSMYFFMGSMISSLLLMVRGPPTVIREGLYASLTQANPIAFRLSIISAIDRAKLSPVLADA